MKKKLVAFIRNLINKAKILFAVVFGRVFLRILFMTCRFKIIGLDDFIETIKNQRCIIMLWHNRLALIPYILSHYTKDFTFAALVSASRDGKLLEAIINSYKRGFTIRVGHQARYQALNELVRTIEERRHIVILTPDGPRGPMYEMKPGVAVAALETGAQVVALNWDAKQIWELKTWDRLRFPRLFTSITVTFKNCPNLNQMPPLSLEEAISILKESLPIDCIVK